MCMYIYLSVLHMCVYEDVYMCVHRFDPEMGLWT